MLTYRQMQVLAECPFVENGRFFGIDGEMVLDMGTSYPGEYVEYDPEDDYYDPMYPENYEEEEEE